MEMNKMLILFCLWFISISINPGVRGSDIYEELIPEPQYKTELSNLSIECQLLIIEKLDLNDLVSIAHTSRQLHNLASDVFRRKYSSKTITFGFSLDTHLAESFVEVGETIRIQNYHMIFIFFEAFGHVIRDLYLSYLVKDLNPQFHQTIVKYCSNSLISIRFDRLIEQICMSKFEKVENLTITNGDLKSSESQWLNQTFPNLKQLNLYYNEVLDMNALNINFPFLEGVVIAFLYTDDNDIEIAMEKLFVENPQVKNIELQFIRMEFLKTVSKRLPNLNHLELHWPKVNQYTGDRIDFDNIKTLQVLCNQYSSWEILHFERLEELDIAFSANECFNLVIQNQNLTKLIVQNDLKQSEVVQLQSHFRNLEELTLGCKSDVETNILINLIEQNKNLRKFSLNKYTSYTFDDKLRNHFKTGWKWDAVSMERI